MDNLPVIRKPEPEETTIEFKPDKPSSISEDIIDLLKVAAGTVIYLVAFQIGKK